MTTRTEIHVHCCVQILLDQVNIVRQLCESNNNIILKRLSQLIQFFLIYLSKTWISESQHILPNSIDSVNQLIALNNRLLGLC